MGYSSITFTPIKLDQIDSAIARPYGLFEEKDALLRYEVDELRGGALPTSEPVEAVFENGAEIRFINCPAFRLGDPNDEGFYSDGISRFNDSIYNIVNFPKLDWGAFYEVHGTSLETFP